MKTPKKRVRAEGSAPTQTIGSYPGKMSRSQKRYGMPSRAAAREAVKGGADSKQRGAGPAEPASADATGEGEEKEVDQQADVASAQDDAAASAGAAPSADRETKAEAVRAVGALAHGSTHATGAKKAKEQTVNPTDGSTFHGSAGENTCLPGDVTGGSVSWTVVTNPTTWGVSVTSFTTTGAVKVMPWPSKPTSMETPNTANPVDNGNIKKEAGHKNDYRFAIKEMKEYHMANGGRSNHWHAYNASKAHEQKHWDHDWMVTCIGTWWPIYNVKLDAITISKASASDASLARPLLQAKVNRLCRELDGKLTTAWNAIPDSPGLAGSNGYVAGQAVLDGLITNVEDYAKTKGWM